jgi:hypothetical protein
MTMTFAHPSDDGGKVESFSVVDCLIEKLLECCHEMLAFNLIVINSADKLEIFEIIVALFRCKLFRCSNVEISELKN